MNNKIEIIIYYFKKQCKQLKITLMDQWRIFKPSEKLVKNYIINTIYVNMFTVKIRWKCYVKDQKLYTEICCSAIKKFITKKNNNDLAEFHQGESGENWDAGKLGQVLNDLFQWTNMRSTILFTYHFHCSFH